MCYSRIPIAGSSRLILIAGKTVPILTVMKDKIRLHRDNNKSVLIEGNRNGILIVPAK
jgi:hypothetical protein